MELPWLMGKSGGVNDCGPKSRQVQRAGGGNEPDVVKKQTGIQGDWPRGAQFQVRSERPAGSDHGTYKTPHSQVLN